MSSFGEQVYNWWKSSKKAEDVDVITSISKEIEKEKSKASDALDFSIPSYKIKIFDTLPPGCTIEGSDLNDLMLELEFPNSKPNQTSFAINIDPRYIFNPNFSQVESPECYIEEDNEISNIKRIKIYVDFHISKINQCIESYPNLRFETKFRIDYYVSQVYVYQDIFGIDYNKSLDVRFKGSSIHQVGESPNQGILISNHRNDIKDKIIENFKNEIKNHKIKNLVINNIIDFSKGINEYTIKDWFSHVIDIVGVDNFSIENKYLSEQSLYASSIYQIVDAHKNISVKVLFKLDINSKDYKKIDMNDKSIDALYEISEGISKIRGFYKDCDIFFSMPNGQILLEISPKMVFPGGISSMSEFITSLGVTNETERDLIKNRWMSLRSRVTGEVYQEESPFNNNDGMLNQYGRRENQMRNLIR